MKYEIRRDGFEGDYVLMERGKNSIVFFDTGRFNSIEMARKVRDNLNAELPIEEAADVIMTKEHGNDKR